MRLERVPFVVRTVVEDCVKAQAAKAAEKSIALEFVGLEGAGQTVLQADSALRENMAAPALA